MVRPVPRKLQPSVLSNQAYAALKEMIGAHRFDPGARVNVEALTRELGVSRTPIWEAVARLEHEGLLERVPHRGVFMAVLTLEKALDLYAVRELLEGLAARLAATRIKDRSLKEMAACLEKQRGLVATGDVMGYSKADFDLHGAVYAACGNDFLREMLEKLKAQMRPMGIHIERILPALYQDHLRLYEALAARDPDQAEVAFRAHNRFLMQHIRELLGARGEAEESGSSAAPGQATRGRPARST
jgi:DNA-binding GntR family transcriptional regulator